MFINDSWEVCIERAALRSSCLWNIGRSWGDLTKWLVSRNIVNLWVSPVPKATTSIVPIERKQHILQQANKKPIWKYVFILSSQWNFYWKHSKCDVCSTRGTNIWLTDQPQNKILNRFSPNKSKCVPFSPGLTRPGINHSRKDKTNTQFYTHILF